MESVSKRLKTEEAASVQDDPSQATGSKPSEDVVDDVDYEMLIEDELEALGGCSEDKESVSELSASSSTSENAAVLVDSMNDATAATDGLQVKGEPDANEEIDDLQRGSAEEDIKVLACTYHRSDSGKEFIKVETAMLSTVDQLNCSAQLVHEDLEVCLQNFGCMMFIGTRFLAKLEPINVDNLKQATSFAQAKSILLGQLRVVQIVLDEVAAERNSQRAALHNFFEKIRLGVATCRSSAVDAAQILRIAESFNTLNYCKLCEQLCDNSNVSGELKEQAVKLLRIEREIQRRNEFLECFYSEFHDDAEELNIALLQISAAVISNKANSLLDAMPQFLGDLLKDISRLTICRVHENDVKAFHEIGSVLNVEVFRKALTDLATRWIDHLNSSETSVALLNPNYVALCRSLAELITAITDSSDHRPEELLRSDQGGWYPLETAIKWKLETKHVWYLEREYKFLFQLINHFHPTAGTVGPFEYQASRSLEGTIADELRVWFYLLDYVLRDLNLGPFEQIVTSFVQLLQKSDGDQVEKIRIFAHSIGRFIGQTCLLANSVQSDEDKQILHSQLDVINRAMFGCANSFRDLLDVITLYWKNRCEIVENIPSKNSVLAIVTFALRPNDEVHNVITLLRNVNAFFASQPPRAIEPNMDQDRETQSGESSLALSSSEASTLNVEGNDDDESNRTSEPTLSVILSPLKIKQQTTPDVKLVNRRVMNTKTKVKSTISSSMVASVSSSESSRFQAATSTVERRKRPTATRRIKKRSHACEICHASFASLSYLKVHKRSHTGERPFVCKICNKGFTSNGSLAFHKAVHTEERPFSCPVCGKTYKYLITLKIHAKNKNHVAETAAH